MKIRFRVERDIGGRDPGELWTKLSDVASIPRYWHGHREVKVLESEGSKHRVQIVYAFPSLGKGNVGESIIEVDRENKALSFDNYKGPVKGTIKVWIDEIENKIICVYDVEMSPFYAPVRGWVVEHFRRGVEHAFDRLLNSPRESGTMVAERRRARLIGGAGRTGNLGECWGAAAPRTLERAA